MAVKPSRKFLFGAKSTVVENDEFIVTVSTAKEGFFKGLSTIIYQGAFPFGRACAKFSYPKSARRSDRHKFHDIIASGLDEAASNGGNLYEAVEAVAGFMEEHGMVEHVMNIC